jgi:hypothetical protein
MKKNKITIIDGILILFLILVVGLWIGLHDTNFMAG